MGEQELGMGGGAYIWRSRFVCQQTLHWMRIPIIEVDFGRTVGKHRPYMFDPVQNPLSQTVFEDVCPN